MLLPLSSQKILESDKRTKEVLSHRSVGLLFLRRCATATVTIWMSPAVTPHVIKPIVSKKMRLISICSSFVQVSELIECRILCASAKGQISHGGETCVSHRVAVSRLRMSAVLKPPCLCVSLVHELCDVAMFRRGVVSLAKVHISRKAARPIPCNSPRNTNSWGM